VNIPRTKDEEPIHVPLNDAAVAALKVVHARGDGKGRVFQSEKTGAPLENGRHWFDDAVIEAGIKNCRWHDLRHTFASRLRMKGAPLEDIAGDYDKTVCASWSEQAACGGVTLKPSNATSDTG
jgi:integrase